MPVMFTRLPSTAAHMLQLALFIAAGLLTAVPAPADEPAVDEFEVFDDAPLDEALSYPPWFKLSFLDLAEDLDEAVQGGKQGLMVYFGQKYCAHCKKLLVGNFGKLDILAYTQKHFDAIGIDIHGDRAVTGIGGIEWTERHFAAEQGVDFTPTLIFYDSEKREALRLSGYSPPYKFRAARE